MAPRCGGAPPGRTAGERERVRPQVLARTVAASVFAPADKSHPAGGLGWLRAPLARFGPFGARLPLEIRQSKK